jgi:hypothetical protein
MELAHGYLHIAQQQLNFLDSRETTWGQHRIGAYFFRRDSPDASHVVNFLQGSYMHTK